VWSVSIRRAGKGSTFDTGIQQGARVHGLLVLSSFSASNWIREWQRRARSIASVMELASACPSLYGGSIPDDQLLDLSVQASSRILRVLEQQVRRMLADQRARALGHQTLRTVVVYLRNISTAPDEDIFPDFDDNLRQGLARETEMLFETSFSRTHCTGFAERRLHVSERTSGEALQKIPMSTAISSAGSR